MQQIEGEMEIRTGEVAAVKEQLRTLDAMCEGEKVARGEADQALEAGLVAAEKRLCTQHELVSRGERERERERAAGGVPVVVFARPLALWEGRPLTRSLGVDAGHGGIQSGGGGAPHSGGATDQ